MSAGSERKLRRKEFAGGTPLRLPDGQVWWFYRPEPVVGEAGLDWGWGGVRPEEAASLNVAVRKVVERLATAETWEDRVRSVTGLAWVLLARNYAITPQRFDRVLASHGPMPVKLWERLERFVVEMEEGLEKGSALLATSGIKTPVQAPREASYLQEAAHANREAS